MKKLLTLVSIIVVLGLVSSIAFAVPKNNPATEPIDSVTLIHYKDGSVKIKGGGETCFKLLGVKWSSLPVSYVINPTNPQGLTEEFIKTSIYDSAEEWDNHTSKELFNDNYGINYTVKWGVADKKNTYSFGNYQESGVIAVTTYWYTRYGKQLVEYDVMFDTDFNWGDAVSNTSLMDLESIALHETGHGVGLADVYNSVCSNVVMYGYGDYGEVKRVLTQPDITGLQKMYGT